MRTVRIDFTNQSVSYPDGTLAGRRGEHLMTQLIISLPEDCLLHTSWEEPLSFDVEIVSDRVLSDAEVGEVYAWLFH